VGLRKVRLPRGIVRNAVELIVNATYPWGTVTTVPAVS
jgi:predicted subunit of tRNA(5-methylaminomethyl-2-thiouridylate) methyltransferase